MRFNRLRLQNFRNIEFADVPLHEARTFLLGQNGQGKSNLLEALGLATACRSFRTQNMSVLPRKGSEAYTLFYSIEHEHYGPSDLEITGGRKGRRVIVDGENVSRMGDFIGRFPVVAMSSGDIQLLRGSPAERRRFLDMTLCAIDPVYFGALRDYHRGIAERNRLLKNKAGPAEFDAFEQEIARRSERIRHGRARIVPRLAEVLTALYHAMAEAEEGPFIEYRPNSEARSEVSFLEELRASRQRDLILGATQKGPHRDDLALGLEIGGAREYASDGQQRALCVALRVAQASVFQQSLSIKPVLLADDVLGELDPGREAGFWKSCPPDLQIIATGTEAPQDAGSWRILEVESGRIG